MSFTQVDAYDYLEFGVAVAKDAGRFKARAFAKEGRGIVAESDLGTREEAEAQVKSMLREMSNDFFGMEGAINRFLGYFPKGFEEPLYYEWERTYKREACALVRETLARQAFDDAIASGDFDGLAQRIKSGMQATNLVSPFEKARFGDALKRPDFQKRYVPVLRELMYGDHDTAFPEHVHVLKGGDALTWPIATYFPFFLDPGQHMFMKPEVMQTCARRLGFELHYETPPTLESYQSLLAFADFVRNGIVSLEPESNIDIHSFLYAVGAPGYENEFREYSKSKAQQSGR